MSDLELVAGVFDEQGRPVAARRPVGRALLEGDFATIRRVLAPYAAEQTDDIYDGNGVERFDTTTEAGLVRYSLLVSNAQRGDDHDLLLSGKLELLPGRDGKREIPITAEHGEALRRVYALILDPRTGYQASQVAPVDVHINGDRMPQLYMHPLPVDSIETAAHEMSALAAYMARHDRSLADAVHALSAAIAVENLHGKEGVAHWIEQGTGMGAKQHVNTAMRRLYGEATTSLQPALRGRPDLRTINQYRMLREQAE